jgi:hypothetical protein
MLGCGIAAALVFGSVVLMIGGCGLMLIKGAAGFPAYAKAEIVNPANRDVTDQINKLIVASNSLGEAQQKIGAEDWPKKVIFIGFKPDTSASSTSGVSSSTSYSTSASTDPKEAFKRTTWSSNSTFSMNGNGYGSLSTPEGNKDIVIIERSQDTGNGVTLNYVVYIEHLPEKGAP